MIPTGLIKLVGRSRNIDMHHVFETTNHLAKEDIQLLCMARSGNVFNVASPSLGGVAYDDFMITYASQLCHLFHSISNGKIVGINCVNMVETLFSCNHLGLST